MSITVDKTHCHTLTVNIDLSTLYEFTLDDEG